MSAAREFADRTWLVVLSRVSMALTAPMAAALVWFGSQWLDQRFDAQTTAISAVSDRVKSLEDDGLPTRLTVLEHTIIDRGTARDRQFDSMAAIQAEQSSKIDKLIDIAASMQSDIAGITATIKARP